VHFVGCVGVFDGVAVGAYHGTGVEAGIHLHNAHAGFGVARFDGALYRGGTAPARQQRGVDVEAAVCGCVEHGLRQNQPIGGHHHHIGILRAQKGLCFFVAQGCGLGDGQAQFKRGLFYRAGLKLHAAAFGAVGLGEHQRISKPAAAMARKAVAAKSGVPAKITFIFNRPSEKVTDRAWHVRLRFLIWF
jgi:hypothetical protein